MDRLIVRVTIDLTVEDKPGAMRMIRERVMEGADGYVKEYLDLVRADLDPEVIQTSVGLLRWMQ